MAHDLHFIIPRNLFRVIPTLLKRCILLLAIAAWLGGCGPSIKFQVMKPPEIDMAGKSRISVLPFDYSPVGIDSIGDFFVHILADSINLVDHENRTIKESAEYTTQRITETLNQTGYFQLVDPSPVGSIRASGNQRSRAKEIGTKLGVEALMIGKVDRADCENEIYYEEQTTRKEKTSSVPWIRRKCNFSLTYRILDTATENVIAIKSFSKEQQWEVKQQDELSLPYPDTVFREMIDEIVPEIAKQLAPYTVTESRSLMEDETKDPTLARGFALAESERFREARDLFLEQWHNTGNPVAGYNAAMLHEALGEIDEAIKLMQQLASTHPDPKYGRELQRLYSVLDEQKAIFLPGILSVH